MIHAIFLATLVSLGTSLSDPTTTRVLQKRESGKLSCYNAGNIIDFSGWCPTLNWPIQNDRGLQVISTLYFALAAATIPDDTVYYAQENIVCTVTQPGPSITVSLNAGASGPIVSGGGSVTFNMSFPNKDYSVCMFTQGTRDKKVADPITLAQARSLLYKLITAPAIDCKTCGRIPIRYPNVTDGADAGGILKIDVIYANTCIGKCVGPNSFSTASKSSGTSSTSSGTSSTSNGTPSASSGTPSASNGTPAASSGTPPASSGTPAKISYLSFGWNLAIPSIAAWMLVLMMM